MYYKSTNNLKYFMRISHFNLFINLFVLKIEKQKRDNYAVIIIAVSR